MRGSKRGLAGVAAAVLALAAALSGCANAGVGDSGAGKGKNAEAATGAEAIVAVSAFPDQRAAEGQFDQEYFQVLTNTQATLIRNPYVTSKEDPNALTQDLYNWEGVLAESWDISKDGTVITFHLRRGVLSQAGNPFTADDVLWSFERKFAANPGGTLGLTDWKKQVKKVDDYTVTITVDQAGYVLPLMAVLAKYQYYMYDSTLLKQHVTADDPYAVKWSSDNGNYGYGAYRIASMKDGEEYVLEANPNYPLTQPKITKVTYRVIPEAGTRALMLKNGDVDAAESLLPADLVDLQASPDVQTYHPETNETLFAYLNTTAGQFANKAVREAFAYAVPYDQIIEQVYRGRAASVQGWLDERLPGRDTTGIPQLSYDPDKAKQILADAGIKTPVDVHLLVAEGFADLQGAAVQIQNGAKDAGFNFTIDTLTTSAESDRRIKRDFDVRLEHGMVISRESVPYTLTIFTNPNDRLGGWAGWAPEEYGKLINEGSAAGDSLSPEAMAIWHKAEVMFTNAYPVIQLASLKSGFASRSTVHGWADRSDPSTDWGVMSLG